ncbi:MAG: hypothetical protein WED87_06155 [Dehalococcoidia bacterium]
MAPRKRVRMTVLRQFIVGVCLTLFNLAGALLTLSAIGGRGDWTVWQFVGLFGLFEWATGIAIILGPNAWQLPIKRAQQPGGKFMLECRTLLTPHWAPGVKTASGFALMCAAAVVEGVGPATLGVPVLAFFIVVACMALSLMLARLGVARPDLDVLGIVIKRPGHTDRELPGLSLGALLVQFILNILTIPAVKLFPPTFLYQPELGPSLFALGWSGAVAAVLAGLALLSWRGNLRWTSGTAPRRRPKPRPSPSTAKPSEPGA